MRLPAGSALYYSSVYSYQCSKLNSLIFLLVFVDSDQRFAASEGASGVGGSLNQTVSSMRWLFSFGTYVIFVFPL